MKQIDIRSDKTNLGDVIYDYIVQAILSHELKPGDRLRPEDLAATIKVSPTPVKHALARLAGEGLVEYKPGIGPFVSAPTTEEILELYDARLMCEIHAIHMGIHRVDSSFIAEMERLREVHREAYWMENNDSYDAQRKRSEADRDYHLHHVSLWPNNKVRLWYQQLNVHLRAFQLVHIPRYHRDDVIAEHHAICDALKSRDVGLAVKAVTRHVEASKQSFLTRVRMAGLA